MSAIARRSPKLPPNYGTQEVRDAVETLEDRPRLPEKTPLGTSADGFAGQVVCDENYIYIYTRSSGWKRAALSAF